MIVFPRRCSLSMGMFFVIIIFFLMISRTLFSQSFQVSLAEGGMPSKRTFDRLLWSSSASSLSSSFSLWSWRFSFEVLICSKVFVHSGDIVREYSLFVCYFFQSCRQFPFSRIVVEPSFALCCLSARFPNVRQP